MLSAAHFLCVLLQCFEGQTPLTLCCLTVYWLCQSSHWQLWRSSIGSVLRLGLSSTEAWRQSGCFSAALLYPQEVTRVAGSLVLWLAAAPVWAAFRAWPVRIWLVTRSGHLWLHSNWTASHEKLSGVVLDTELCNLKSDLSKKCQRLFIKWLEDIWDCLLADFSIFSVAYYILYTRLF